MTDCLLNIFSFKCNVCNKRSFFEDTNLPCQHKICKSCIIKLGNKVNRCNECQTPFNIKVEQETVIKYVTTFKYPVKLRQTVNIWKIN